MVTLSTVIFGFLGFFMGVYIAQIMEKQGLKIYAYILYVLSFVYLFYMGYLVYVSLTEFQGL